ncbi:MAG: tandem-95 repeat protein, partial [Candidatus Magasanikbacteria bacterium]|nr:tandem-95 repeat protein [Candidatus Magasanikbacteria bacterium]
TGNDTDVDGDALVIASVTSGAGGTAVLNPDGTVSFTPNANFNGAADFTYTVSDGTTSSNAATVTVNVAPVNDAPVAVADTLSATEDTPAIYTAAQLTGNDTDVDGDALVIASVTSGAGGTALLNPNGTVSFTPNANFNGAANFTYTVSDGTTSSNAATVTVNVAPVNDAPTGAVSITGVAAQSYSLTASNTLADADGIGAISYQWLADDIAINGATGGSFVLTAAQVGKVITVLATYVDSQGSIEQIGSSATNPVLGYQVGTPGNDTLIGTIYSDTLIGLGGNDNINGNAGNDTINGDAGNDFITGGLGDDSIDGGTGFDTVNYGGATGAVTVSLLSGTATGADGSDTLISIENVFGSGFDDTLIGDATNNNLRGGAGNDAIVGGSGFDILTGGAGDDTLDGGAYSDKADYSGATGAVTVSLVSGTATGADGNDTLSSIETVTGSHFSDTLIGGNPNSIYVGLTADPNTSDPSETFEGLGGSDTITGGSNINLFTQVNYISATSAVNVTLNGTATDGWGGTDTLSNIDKVQGSIFADVLTGGSSNVHSVVSGPVATSFFEGFDGGLGNDTINGGSYTDRVYYDRASGSVTVVLDTDQNGTNGFNGTATGADGNDVLIDIEAIRASNFADSLTGSTADNSIEGMGGNDTIDGGAGIDTISFQRSTAAVTVTFSGVGSGTAVDGFGGTDNFTNIEAVRGSDFNDTLIGGAGNDTFEGKAGNDSIDGGGGTDTVVFTTSLSGVTVNLGTSSAIDSWGNTDTLIAIENILGSAFNDTLTGDGNNNVIEGSYGNDSIDGCAGTD